MKITTNGTDTANAFSATYILPIVILLLASFSGFWWKLDIHPIQAGFSLLGLYVMVYELLYKFRKKTKDFYLYTIGVVPTVLATGFFIYGFLR